MIKEAIIKLSKRQDLTYKEAEQVMNEIMEGTTPATCRRPLISRLFP